MSAEMIPDHRHRLAYGLGLLFHPYLVSVGTLFVVLESLPVAEALLWVVSLSTILILPLILLTHYARQRKRYVYQRTARTPLYLSFEVSVVLCLLLIGVFGGPPRLMACFLALLIWMPVQFVINTYYTKISVHAAVTAACGMGLLWFGTLESWPLRGLALLVILATGWARYKTKNHTPQQILLGWLVGIGAVLMAFPLVL